MGCGSSKALRIQAEKEASTLDTSCHERKLSSHNLYGDRLSMMDARYRRESRCANQQRRASLLAPFEADRVRERRKSSCTSLTMNETVVRIRDQSLDESSHKSKDSNNNLPGYSDKTMMEAKDFPSVRVDEYSGSETETNSTDDITATHCEIITEAKDYERVLPDVKPNQKNGKMEESAAMFVDQIISKALKIAKEK